ncbi:MAG: twin-arginine translocase subunit TatC [Bacteroidales bacterium]|nr:twin-arginine translocase subunit TatC [Bacteroidales bacterium]
MTFWEHLDELRGCLVRIVVAALVAAVVAFFFKDFLFSLVLAPKESYFITYRLFSRITGHVSQFRVDLINVEIAQQFLTHMKVALWAGLLVVSPYVIYVLFGFVSPALYKSEKRYAVRAVGGGYVMFLLGVALNYLIIFPLTFRFLGTYQVSNDVVNMISLTSYISMFITMSLIMGAVFELPILSWLLAKMGLLKPEPMKRYRRHAVVAILVISAVITPTGDIFTLSIVALPIYLLYELSVIIVSRTCSK